MRTIRLTNSMRASIRCNLMVECFQKDEDTLDALRVNLGVTIWRHQYTEQDQELMMQLPLGFLPRVLKIVCTYMGRFDVFDLKKDLPVKYADVNGFSFYRDVAPKEYVEYITLKGSIAEKQEKARISANQILYSVNSVNQLIEAWPEVEPYIPEQVMSCTALTVSTNGANELLGLPKKA